MLKRLRTAAAILVMATATALALVLIGQSLYDGLTMTCRERGGIESQYGWQDGQPVYICVGD